MYRTAYSQDGKVVFYLDPAGNKYVVSGGSLAWRLNNPGLVHNTGRFHFGQGGIGHFNRFAIFDNPEQGLEALSRWLRAKKYFHGSLKTLAKHYQPDNPGDFANRLSALTSISIRTKVKNLNEQEFQQLLFSITKLCDYIPKGDEKIALLPKITARIEHGEDSESSYLIGGSIILSKKEAIEWAQSNRLDAVIVQANDGPHLRSRPHHRMTGVMRLVGVSQNIDSVARVVGDVKPSQCIWAFINGIDNTKEEALRAAKRISNMAGGERVLSMPNDTRNVGADLCQCLILKTSIDTPIVQRAVNFVRYLLALEKEEHTPIVIFAHSQGAIILEHALKLIEPNEAKRLRIFTFGGGSFIAPGNSHPDSHNYASAADPICLMGSPNLQSLALKRYYAHKDGLTDAQMIERWAITGALFQLDRINTKMVKKCVEEKIVQYQEEFRQISNLTILDPDFDSISLANHEFVSDCYQMSVQKIVQKYHEHSTK